MDAVRDKEEESSSSETEDDDVNDDEDKGAVAKIKPLKKSKR